MRNKRGFTLIELLVVIGVIGILSAIAIPTISSWLPNYRLKAAARDLYSAAMKAKTEAVKRNANCAITFNQAVGGVTNAYIVFVDADGNCEFGAGEFVITQVQQWPNQTSLDATKGGGDGLSFTNNDDGNPTISFQPNAIPTGNGGGMSQGTAFLINTNGRSQSVVINQSGNVRID